MVANIVQYARHGELTAETTKSEIVVKVSPELTPSMLTRILTRTNGSTLKDRTHTVDKKIVPSLKDFSGYDEDWYHWKDESINTLGRAALSGYLTDQNLVATNPEVATSVFYAFKAALDSGKKKPFI